MEAKSIFCIKMFTITSLALLCMFGMTQVGYADPGEGSRVVKIAPRSQADGANGNSEGVSLPFTVSSRTSVSAPFTASSSTSMSAPFTATFSSTTNATDPFTESSKETGLRDPFTASSSIESSENDPYSSSSQIEPSAIVPSVTSSSSSSSVVKIEVPSEGKRALYNGYLAFKNEYADNYVSFRYLNANLDFAEKLLEESDIQELKNGATILFSFKYEGFQDDELTSSEIENIKKYIESNDLTIYGIAEAFVCKSLIRDGEYIYKDYPITDFKGNQLSISIDLPDFEYDLKKGYERDYALFKVSNGPIEVIKWFKDPKVTFSISGSGYYCAAFKDVKAEGPALAVQDKKTTQAKESGESSSGAVKSSATSSTPKTADSTALLVGFIASVLGAVLASIALIKKSYLLR